MTYIEIIEKVANQTGIPKDIVNKTYKTYWKYIRELISSIPLKNDIKENEFNQLRTNFNIPSLGKLTCNYNRYIGVRKRFEYIKNLRKKNYEKDKDD